MGRTCYCCGRGDCDAFLCRSLSGDGSVNDGCVDKPISEEAKNHSFSKIKYTLSGFKDWNYDGSYSGFFKSDSQGIEGTQKGTATVDLKISVSNLDIFNRDYIFYKTDLVCLGCCREQSMSPSPLKKNPCAFTSNEEYIGEVEISFTTKLSSLDAVRYASNIFSRVLSTEGGNPSYCDPRNTFSCNGSVVGNPQTRVFQGSSTDELLGGLSLTYKFDVYLNSQDIHINHCSNCSKAIDGRQPLSFAWILKETNASTSGVYNNYGYRKIDTAIICDCHPHVCNIELGPFPTWPCRVTNCEKKMINIYAECRSFFTFSNGAVFLQKTSSDTHQQFFNDTITINGFVVQCRTTCIPTHSNFKNVHSLSQFPFVMFMHAMDCSSNTGFFMDILATNSQNPCLQWDDITKKMKEEYINSCSPSLAKQVSVAFSNVALFKVGDFSDTNYSKDVLNCYASGTSSSICDSNDNQGFLMSQPLSESGLQTLLYYIMNFGGYKFSCDNNYIEDKTAILDPRDDWRYPNFIIPVPSCGQGMLWTDIEPIYNFIIDNNWQQYKECNNFSRFFGYSSWNAISPTAIGVVDTENAKIIDPVFVLSKPLNIKVEAEYE